MAAGAIDHEWDVVVLVIIRDRKRVPASGSVIVAGAASRSKTADE
jgi:hypothetical protein